MRPLIALLFLFALSCKSLTEEEKRRQDISGKWLILYADHKLKSDREQQLYSKMQDSIVGLTALKLVSFSDDGSFIQMDSLYKKGQWDILPDYRLEIGGGGKGFDLFRAEFIDYKNGEMQLAEYVMSKGESIKLVWHLKRINDRPAADLLTPGRNKWRIKPLRSEDDKNIKKRLADMLNYYSEYYRLVTEESTYFIPGRVLLPFKFYQHGIGLKSFDTNSSFTHFFFNDTDAQTAYQYLREALLDLQNDFPSGKNFIDEYAKFMKMMADELMKK